MFILKLLRQDLVVVNFMRKSNKISLVTLKSCFLNPLNIIGVDKVSASIAKEMERYYKTADKYYERLKSHHEEAYQEYASFINRYVSKQTRILDIACGIGLSTFMLGRFAGEVTGVDISPLGIQTAKGKYGQRNVNFTCASVLDLPFPDQEYDVVSTFLAVEHFHNLPQALSEMVRVTKKGGLIIILSPNLLSPFAELYKLFDTPVKSVYLAIYKAVLLLWKSFRLKGRFRYRMPLLENRFDIISDSDAVYLSNPVDLYVWFIKNGLSVIKYQRETVWGRVFPSFATGIHIVACK